MAVTCGGANVRVRSRGYKRARCVVLLVLLGLAMPGVETGQKNKAAIAAQPSTVQRKQWTTTRLPLSFEPNEGQTDRRVKFLARGSGYTLFLTGDEAVLALRKSEVRSQKLGARTGSADLLSRSAALGFFRSRSAELDDNSYVARNPNPESRIPAVLRMKLAGANQAAKVTALEELPGKTNYFIGNDPKKWRVNVPNYAKVRYFDLYPGVDLVYYGREGQLEYDFVVAPGTDPKAIQLAVVGAGLAPPDGAQGPEGERAGAQQAAPLRIDASGDLVVQAEGGEVRFHKPVVYQEQSSVVSPQLSVLSTGAQGATDNGQRTTDNRKSKIQNRQLLDGRYVLTADNRIGFEVSRYDKNKPLVIDPVLSYSTYLGGTGGDVAYGIAVDSSGEAFVTGITNSADFPTQAASGGSVFQSSNKGNGDAFVTKLNAAGTALVYSTYLGGSGSDTATAIAVSASGVAFVTGTTTSPDFPTASTATTGAFQTKYGGNGDAFFAQLKSDGSTLFYSSYLGGTGADFGQGIAVDSSGNAYVTGSTQSVDFPVATPLQAGNGGSSDAFVAKVNFDGSQLLYSTYLGGVQADVGQAIRVDASFNAYVAGYTFSSNFPTVKPYQSSNASSNASQADAFVSEVNAAGTALVFSTYLGGSGDDRAFGIALDTSGSIYVTGVTQSTDFPTTLGVLQPTNLGQGDAFVSKLSSNGAALTYSTFLGGSGLDQGNAIAVDSSGNAFVTGFTQSSPFPTANAVQAMLGISGGSSCGTTFCADAFVSQLNPSGSALVYSTYLGGSKADFGQAIALDASGDPYVAGSTSSTNFPAIAGAFQGSLTGVAGTAFVAKVDPSNTSPGIALAPAKVNFGNQTLGVRSAVETATVINASTTPLSITQITSSSADFAEVGTCANGVTVPGGGGTCTIDITFTPSTTGSETDQITITDNAPGSPHTITVTGTGVTSATAVTVSATSLTFAGQTVGTVSAPQTVTITNTGTSTLDISSISASGDFSQTNTCGATLNQLAVGQSCTASVSFAPTASGARSGTLSISDNAAGSPQSVALGGTGLAVFSVSSTSSKTTVVIGSASATFTVSASAPAGFTGSITLSCSSGAACAFSPASIFGGQTSTLTLSGLTASTANPFNFTVNGTSGSQTATLPLTVLFSDYSLSASPALDTIVSGASANYTVVVSPLNGFNQGVQMGCTSLPPGSSCTFSSSSVTPKGSPATVMLTLQTTKTASAPMKPWKPFSGAPPPLGLWLASIGLVWSLIRLGRRVDPAGTMAGPRRIGFRLASLTFVLALAAFWGSCRSVSSTPSGTPIGNYSITITGTLSSSTAVVRSTTVNLSVNPIP